MRKLALATLFMSVFVVQSAFAQNLGKLSAEKIPQKLISVAEFEAFLKSPTLNQTQENQDRNAARNENDFWGWGSMYGYGYYPYMSYFPYYYGSYYYPYYGYGYGYGWADEQGGNQAIPTGATRSLPPDAAHSPVVCFANDQSGNWFAGADLALNVANAQNSANRECSASGGTCHLSQGCAVAYGDPSPSR